MKIKLRIRQDKITGRVRIDSVGGHIPEGEHFCTLEVEPGPGYIGRALFPMGAQRTQGAQAPETILEWAAHMIREGANSLRVCAPDGSTFFDFAR